MYIVSCLQEIKIVLIINIDNRIPPTSENIQPTYLNFKIFDNIKVFNQFR